MDVAGFLLQLDELFELTPGTLTMSSVLEETPGWSSLTFLGLIALVDDQYQVTLKPRQVHQCATIADIYNVVEEHSTDSAMT